LMHGVMVGVLVFYGLPQTQLDRCLQAQVIVVPVVVLFSVLAMVVVP